MPRIWIRVMTIIALLATIAHGRVYSTREEALLRVFGEDAKVEKVNLYLSRDEAEEIAKRAKVKDVSRLFTYYRGTKDGRTIAYVTFVSHVVRTKYAVTMVVLNPDLSIRKVEVVAFYEPEEYIPEGRWFKQFSGKRLTPSLWPRRDIQTVTGATLSVNTIVRETRKVLAIFERMVQNRKKER